MNLEKVLGKVIMMIDTTVLIDFLQDKQAAKKYLSNPSHNIAISRIVELELIRGLRSKKDIALLKKQLKALQIEVFEVNEQISENAAGLFEGYFHNHGLGIMDALIAATAIVYGEKLATHNLKHFQFLKELEVIRPY